GRRGGVLGGGGGEPGDPRGREVVGGGGGGGGLPRGGAGEVREKRTCGDAGDDDWELPRRYGITGVPTFVIDRYGVVGAQPYEALEGLVQKARRAKSEA